MQFAYILLPFVFALCGHHSDADQILFSSSRSGNSDIYLMDANGKNIQQLTTESSEEWSPVWVNAAEISYLSQRGDKISIVRQNLKTGVKTAVKQPDECFLNDKNILYSVDLKKQIFGCDGEVYVLDEQTGMTKNLTRDLNGAANYISWVPAAEAITFTSNHEGNNEVYQLDLATEKMVNLTNNPSNDERGDVSPDGGFLVYSSDRYEKGNQDIVVQNLATGEVQRITESKGTELIARWSKMGDKLYFGSNKDGNWELYAFDIDLQKEVRLTNDAGFDGDPRIH